MNSPQPASPRVLELVHPECSRRFHVVGAREIAVPQLGQGQCALHLALDADGTPSEVPIPPGCWGTAIPGSPHDRIAIVTTEAGLVSLEFPGRHREPGTGRSWDLNLIASVRVADPLLFFRTVKPLVLTGAPLSTRKLETWLNDRLSLAVDDTLRSALATEPFDRVRTPGVLPPGWWQARLETVSKGLGLEVGITDVRWRCTDEEQEVATRREQDRRDRAAEAERRHGEWLRRQAEKEREARIEQARADARFQEELARIRAEELDRQRDLEAQGLANEERLRALRDEFELRREETHQQRLEAEWKGAQRLRDLQLEATLRETRVRTEIAGIELRARQEQQAAADEERRRQETAARASVLHQKELESRLADLDLQAKTLEEQRRLGLESDRTRLDFEREKSRIELETLNDTRERIRVELAAARADLKRGEDESKAAAERAETARLERLHAEERLRQCQAAGEEAVRTGAAESSESARLHDILKSLIPTLGLAALAQLQSGNPSAAYTVGALLGQLGIRAADLAKLGITTPQQFIENFRDAGVVVRKSNLERRTLRTRDLGIRVQTAPTGSVPPVLTTETLRIGSPAGFEIHSRRPGYLTVINPGTTGKFWLLVPNTYRAGVRIEADRTYSLPGDDALPPRNLDAAGLEFAEGGPVGPEYIVAIVSDQPLIDPAILARADPPSPFVRLHAEDLAAIRKRLDDLGTDGWASGVAEFRVVP
ncbi:MAG: DUF4384 domain-containing protein [Verrucomicrobiales bacterium]|nr:DUF4384 domain-containing protein [Verrucomicrobiales bacterium]